MPGPGLITGYLETLAGQLPGPVVEELADGLEETYRRRVDADHPGLPGPRIRYCAAASGAVSAPAPPRSPCHSPRLPMVSPGHCRAPKRARQGP
jgi:hypothetical protein